MISAVVPTLRGEARLARHLPGVRAALEQAGEASEIVVVDDGGGLTTRPPGARLVTLPDNRGYGPAVNAGAAAARGEWLLVLNDDVALETDAVARLRAHFPDPELFAVVPAIRSPLAACGDEGGKRGRFEAGGLEILEAPSAEPQATLYPVGCCFLCPRQRFLALGGFDPVFAPFFWEDVDLGWRAWKRGFSVRHDPRAIAHHEGSATLAEAATLAARERVGFRNRVLFHLRTLEEPRLRAAQFGAWAAAALLEALPERRAGLAEALERHARAPRHVPPGPLPETVSDAEVLRRVAP